MWLVFGVIITTFIAAKLSEASESIAKLLGPIGQHWRNATQSHKEKRIQSLISQYKTRSEEDLANRVDILTTRIAQLEKHYEAAQEYIIADARWHFIYDEYLASTGADIPPRQKHSEFIEKYLAGQRLIDGNWTIP